MSKRHNVTSKAIKSDKKATKYQNMRDSITEDEEITREDDDINAPLITQESLFANSEGEEYAASANNNSVEDDTKKMKQKQKYFSYGFGCFIYILYPMISFFLLKQIWLSYEANECPVY